MILSMAFALACLAVEPASDRILARELASAFPPLAASVVVGYTMPCTPKMSWLVVTVTVGGKTVT